MSLDRWWTGKISKEQKFILDIASNALEMGVTRVFVLVLSHNHTARLACVDVSQHAKTVILHKALGKRVGHKGRYPSQNPFM